MIEFRFRILTPETLPAVLPMVRAFEAEVDSPIITVDERAFLAAWTNFLRLEVGFVIVAYDGDEQVGTISGYVVPDDRSGRTVAQEAWWYVYPEYRGRGLGGLLVTAYEHYARSRGATRCSLGAINKLGAGPALAKLGYEPFEVVHYKTL